MTSEHDMRTQPVRMTYYKRDALRKSVPLTPNVAVYLRVNLLISLGATQGAVRPSPYTC